jgi:demethylmenaquinone methyltransferase/2-methoxy-6-polyprenyl-1,4-benzoquinol methylase
MKLAEVYNRNAAYWDSRLYRSVYYSAYIRLFRALQREGSLRQRLQVLDCGIGAGLLSEALLRIAGYGIELNGVDVSSNLLAISAAKFNRQGVYARLAFGDIRRLPYGNEKLDLVISGLVLEHVAQPLDGLREMVRVLRRDGPLVVVATRRGAPDFYFRRKYRYRPYPEADIVDWMKAAGIANVRVRRLYGIAGIFARAYTGTKA